MEKQKKKRKKRGTGEPLTPIRICGGYSYVLRIREGKILTTSLTIKSMSLKNTCTKSSSEKKKLTVDHHEHRVCVVREVARLALL